MKILLLNPPIDYKMDEAYRTEGLGLGYIASVLRRDGHEVEVLDAHLRCLNLKQTIDEVLARQFDCLGITASNAHKNMLLGIVRAVRKKRKDTLIAAGGYLPTLCAEQLLAACPQIDFIIRGEGEIAAPEVFGRIARNEEWRDAPAVGFIKGGKVVLNNCPSLVTDLDTLPFPARDALKQADFPPESAAIMSGRGCYNRCSFCCIHAFYALSSGKKAPRYRKPECVVDEMESVIAETGVKTFRFVDDDFIGPGEKSKERVIKLADEIKSRKLGINFRIECRADEVDADLLKMLKEIGLTDVFLGIESGVQRQLDTYNKRITVEQNKKAVEIVRSSGVRLRPGFIMLDPYTTIAEIQENLQFIKEMDFLDEVKHAPAPFVTRLELHRGVQLVEQLKNDGLLREKGIDVDYAFKDPLVSLVVKNTMISSAISDMLRRAKKLLIRKS